MSNYYRLAVLSEQKVYNLGKSYGAKDTLPILLSTLDESQDVVLYGDESHAFLEDKYEYNEGFELVSDFAKRKELLKNKGMNLQEFYELFEKHGGLVLSVEKFL